LSPLLATYGSPVHAAKYSEYNFASGAGGDAVRDGGRGVSGVGLRLGDFEGGGNTAVALFGGDAWERASEFELDGSDGRKELFAATRDGQHGSLYADCSACGHDVHG
jgi:hypothetical protein